MKKLPARYTHFVVPLFLTFFMTSIVAAISTINAVGLSWSAVPLWARGWAASWAAAFPAALFMLPFSRWLAGFFVQQPK